MSPESTIEDEPGGSLSIVVATVTDVGCKRANNEDAVCALTHPDSQRAVVVLADGMGGHSSGEVASAVVIEELMSRHAKGRLESGDDISEGVLAADERLAREYPGSGTTVVVTIASTSQAIIGHVGDSRAYLLRKNTLAQLTRDHSWVQLQVDSGHLSQAEARTNPRRNVLLQAVGTGRGDAPDLKTIRFWPGDSILLCSDGLSGVLEDNQILEILSASNPINVDSASRALIAAARDLGAPDNITVALLSLQEIKDPLARVPLI